ncbi:MAG: hypothetical protein ACYC7D_03015 [Nitrososphaerales archaeon]
MSVESIVVEYADQLRNVVKHHETWRNSRTLNLIASENFASPETRSFLSSDLSNRYTARDHFYKGTKYIDEVESLAVKVAKKLYRAKYADVRSISGHTCSLIVFLSFLKSGDKIVTCPPSSGGYPGSSEMGLGPLLGLKNLYFPYDDRLMNIIPSETRDLLESEKPEMTIFGSSFIPFPYNIKGSLPKGYEGVKVYDGSHVMGLIAGGEFQDPLREGASVLMGSTHKSLFGPQGGLILSNDAAVFSVIDSKVYPGIVDNIHWNRVAGLAFALLELLKFGSKYASQVVKNSQALATNLFDLGIPVKCSEIGFTKSHQVILGYEQKKSKAIAKRLECLDIITDTGIRLGTAEVTRRGMKQTEMEEIASILHDSIVRKETNAVILKRVHKLVKEFGGIEYSFSR